MNKSKPSPGQPASAQTSNSHGHATRETVESIVVAVILAFLLRSFLVEPFVIPTGSMAPTLQGKHKDVFCEQCDHQYRAGASIEDDERRRRRVVATVCPICRHRMVLQPRQDANQRTFNGDRIVVSKFAYDLAEPERWDVIVFKFPGNAKQNYIKRLTGLPGETVRIRHGDIYVRKPGDDDFQIARKPEQKQLAMLHLVDDTRHISDQLVQVDWPLRWQPWSPASPVTEGTWQAEDGGRRYTIAAPADREVWLRYRHLVPSLSDWESIREGQKPPGVEQRHGQLISDFYAYNAYISVPVHSDFDPSLELEQYPGDIQIGGKSRLLQGDSSEVWGLHWVGDLALEAEIEVADDEGTLLLTLVEGGLHHQCRINLADGLAELEIDGGSIRFDAAEGDPVERRRATTRLRGRGRYAVRYSNVDDELRLWINGRLVEFDGPTTYRSPEAQHPRWSPEDPGDLAPVGIGSVGATVNLDRLRVLRDVYYVALSEHWENRTPPDNDYDAHLPNDEILAILADPARWDTTRLFRSRRAVTFQLQADQYFPLGDNSPQSQDGRLWPPPPFVERDLLLGKAVYIYWPHSWNRPVPFTPNIPRMGLIR